MTDEDKKHPLFPILNAIANKIQDMEKVLAGCCGRWEWSEYPFFVEKYAGKWRIMEKSDAVNHRPVTDAPIESRIAFAKVSKLFIHAYIDWKTAKLESMREEAAQALKGML